MTATASADGRPAGQRRPFRGPVHWLTRLALGLLALAVLAMPFYAAWQYYVYRRNVTPQATVPAVRIGAAQPAAWRGMAAGLPATSAPVVLAYHDISPRSASPYVITPEAFDAQMAALEAAGYRSLTTEEFTDYLRGGPAPPRSVYITFDDGTHGLWVYGDRILARHHMHAASYLITGKVGHNRPYYLSWQEVQRMSASGRWDFQDHTHDLHWRGAVDEAGHRASALANRLWLPALHRLETSQEYAERVQRDLDQSIADITGHGLPRPQLFAFPFSEATERANLPAYGPSLQTILQARFVAALTNSSSRPLPAGRRAGAAREVQRLEANRRTTPDLLLHQIAQWILVPPSAHRTPLGEPKLWTRPDGTGATGIGALTGQGPYPARTGYVAADYRPVSSADWNDYRVDAMITGLAGTTNNAGVTVREGSTDPVTVSISRNYATLFHGDNRQRTQVSVRTLAPSGAHRVEINVIGSRTTALVDGRITLSWTDTGSVGGNATGGIGINARNAGARSRWPAFAGLTVSSLHQRASDVASAGRLAVRQADPLAADAQWTSAPGVTAAMRISRTGLSPFGHTLSDYAAYEQARTPGWTRYTVRGTVSRLTGSQVSGALWVRVGSPLAISADVSRGQLRVLSGDADSQQLVATRRLADSDHHQVTITVGTTGTWITVDGTVHVTLLAKGETGGIAFSAYRDLTRRSWPTVRDLQVVPAAVR